MADDFIITVIKKARSPQASALLRLKVANKAGSAVSAFHTLRAVCAANRTLPPAAGATIGYNKCVN